jgi:hypothetical protein
LAERKTKAPASTRPTTRAQFVVYFRALADLMGLRDWTVCVGDDPPDNPHHMANADCAICRKFVTFSLSEKFLSGTEDEQRATACHELIHAHLAPMHNYLYKTLTDNEWEAYQIAMEYAVDGIAQSWASHLPPPSRVVPVPVPDPGPGPGPA